MKPLALLACCLLAGCTCRRESAPRGAREKAAERRAPVVGRELPKLAPLSGPELVPLPALRPHILGGRAPSWFAPVAEVRAAAAIVDGQPSGQEGAGDLGVATSLAASAVSVAGVPVGLSYLFQGDNLVGYAVSLLVGEDLPATGKLWDTLLAEAEAAWGAPEVRGVSRRFRGPSIEATAMLTESPAISSRRGKRTQFARLVVTPPKALVQRLLAESGPRR